MNNRPIKCLECLTVPIKECKYCLYQQEQIDLAEKRGGEKMKAQCLEFIEHPKATLPRDKVINLGYGLAFKDMKDFISSL